MLAITTGRRPTRSAIRPATSVPRPPASSISESRWLPCAGEFPIETSHSGTKVISPNQATLRKTITPSRSTSAPMRSRSPGATAGRPDSGAKPDRNGIARSSNARHGQARKRQQQSAA